MFAFMLADTRYRFICLVTQNKRRRDDGASRVLAVTQPWAEANCPRWPVVWWLYVRWVWGLHYAAWPLRRLRGW
jgi:hypothetical protein